LLLRKDLLTEDCGQGLSSIEKLGSGDSIALRSVNRDIDEGLLEGLDDRAAGRDDRSRHDDQLMAVSGFVLTKMERMNSRKKMMCCTGNETKRPAPKVIGGLATMVG
jgi:hypothetical protein